MSATTMSLAATLLYVDQSSIDRYLSLSRDLRPSMQIHHVAGCEILRLVSSLLFIVVAIPRDFTYFTYSDF